VCLCFLVGAEALSVASTRLNRRPASSRTLRPRMGEGADEIAELEAKLAELKRTEEEKKQAEIAAANLEWQRKRMEALQEGGEDEDGSFDFATLSSRKKVAAVKSQAPDELLSEAWKEAEEDGEGGIGLVQILGGVVAAVALIAFSQVPIGQNVDEVTYGGVAPQAQSPDEIRKLYESKGLLDDSE